MSFRLPDALRDAGEDSQALAFLGTYYGKPFGRNYTGAEFDFWDSSGTRTTDYDRFTADDLVSITFLSVAVRGMGAIDILRDGADEINSLLAQVGPDRDLAYEPGPIDRDWPAWSLNKRLQVPKHIGPVIASKLMARKRPRLIPIWDSVVTKVTGTRHVQWEPLRLALAADSQALHHRLLRIRDAAGLSEQVSALRVFDVICWMEGKDRGFGTKSGATG
jgi:hypothetical protein